MGLDLDRAIEQLRQCEPLKESEVKQLCQLVRVPLAGSGSWASQSPPPFSLPCPDQGPPARNSVRFRWEKPRTSAYAHMGSPSRSFARGPPGATWSTLPHLGLFRGTRSLRSVAIL